MCILVLFQMNRLHEAHHLHLALLNSLRPILEASVKALVIFMSFWTYSRFPFGTDTKMAPKPSPAETPSPSSPDTKELRSPQDATASLSPWDRNVRQLGLLFAGAGFMAASVAVARRSVVRKQLESLPRYYVSNRATPKVDASDRSLLAVEAFGLASLNVMSFAIMLTGGVSWAFDLCSVAELRERTRASLRRDIGKANPEDERELEEMMATLLEKLGMNKDEPPESGKPSDKD